MKKILYQFLGLAVVVATATGCSKKLDEVYQNPNAPTKVPPETLLPPVISTLAANSAGHGPLNDIRFIARYVQYWSGNNALEQYERMGGTTGASDNAGSLWRIHYYDLGQNVMRMIDWAAEEKKWDYVGVGKAIMAWSWLQLTDYHGEVILKEAFNTNLLTFKFDKEEDVYIYVRQLCREAIEELNKTGDGVSSENLAKGDAFLYKGDVNKWKKFVYAVMARSFNHLSNKSIYQPDSVIHYANLSMTSNDDNALVRFAATGISANSNFFGPLRNNMNTPSSTRQSAYIANLMAGRNPQFSGVADPRAWYMLKTNANNTFVGYGVAAGNPSIPVVNDRPRTFWGTRWDSVAVPANDANCTYIFRNNAAIPVITASEVLFMKAEAALRKNDRTTARDAYRQAIALNFDMLAAEYNAGVPADRQITAAIRDAFLADPNVVPAAADLRLSHIMLQKYIALFGWGTLETWVDMRRFHYTDTDPATGQQVYRDFTPPTGANLFLDNNGRLVYRVRYRYNAEYVWNLAELEKLGATALDWHTREVWFSKP